jgi:hypothetical protein
MNYLRHAHHLPRPRANCIKNFSFVPGGGALRAMNILLWLFSQCLLGCACLTVPTCLRLLGCEWLCYLDVPIWL